MYVLVLTDSLSLPRAYIGGIVNWEDIYVNLLRKAFPQIQFIHLGIGAATISDLYGQLNYYKSISPDLIILQCGIVDCAPRALGRFELEVVKKLRIFRLIKPFFKILRKYRRITYTSQGKFKRFLELIKCAFTDKPIWSIGILPGCVEYESQVPGIMKNIDAYNGILRENTFFIDVSDISRECIIEDYHHLNALGHKYVFKKISGHFNSYFRSESNFDQECRS